MKKKEKFNSQLFIFKTHIRDFMKYDYNYLKAPFSLLIFIGFYVNYLRGKHFDAIKILSNLFRTGWSGSKTVPTKTIKKLFLKSNENTTFITFFYKSLMDSIQPLPQTEKFFDNPQKLYEGVVIVLKSRTEKEKGVILIKYSYYFPLFFKLFDVKSISENYHIVLEPSWAGLCDPGILVYAILEAPVFVMAYEKRDKEFIKNINTNLISVDIGSNWWVDYRVFDVDKNIRRDIDIVIVAKWAEFKRHSFIFKALKNLKDKGHRYSITLVGYPGDLTLEDIRTLATHFNLEDQMTFHEWITPLEVNKLVQRSKINILWSRFEGDKRSIIEGMFCDTPCILREGSNYGDLYHYINRKTGEWANEANLEQTIASMMAANNSYSPRNYVMENHNCHIATDILSEKIGNSVNKCDGEWLGEISLKVNELHGMKYFNEKDKKKYSSDYMKISDFLK